MSNNNSSNDLDLYGIIGKELEIYNKIMNTYFQYIYEETSGALVNCKVKIKNIKLENSKNCNIKIENKCFANTSLSLNLLLKAILKNLNLLSFELIKKIEKGLGIILSEETINEEDKGVYKRCRLSASVSDIITIDDLNIKNCLSDNQMDFVFYNTGSAEANCGIKEFINSLANKEEEEENNENKEIILNKIFFLNMENLILLLIILLLILILFYSIKSFFDKDNSIRYLKFYFNY